MDPKHIISYDISKNEEALNYRLLHEEDDINFQNIDIMCFLF